MWLFSLTGDLFPDFMILIFCFFSNIFAHQNFAFLLPEIFYDMCRLKLTTQKEHYVRSSVTLLQLFWMVVLIWKKNKMNRLAKRVWGSCHGTIWRSQGWHLRKVRVQVMMVQVNPNRLSSAEVAGEMVQLLILLGWLQVGMVLVFLGSIHLGRCFLWKYPAFYTEGKLRICVKSWFLSVQGPLLFFML